MTPRTELHNIMESQAKILKHLMETNDELDSFNKISENKYEELYAKFKKYGPVIRGISDDLNAIHRCIGRMKKKLNT